MSEVVAGRYQHAPSPLVETTTRVALLVRDELIQDEYVPAPAAHAAYIAAGIEAGEKAVRELFGDDSDALSWIGRAFGYNPEGSGTNQWTYDEAAEYLWKTYDIKVEDVDTYFDLRDYLDRGKVTLSAVVGTERRLAVFDFVGDDDGEGEVSEGHSALASAVKSYVRAVVRGGSAKDFVEADMVDRGELDTTIMLEKSMGSNVALWDGLSEAEKIDLFRKQYFLATKMMTERLDQFRADSERIRGLLASR